MRIPRSAPWRVTALFALALGAAACSAGQDPQAGAAAENDSIAEKKRRDRDSTLNARIDLIKRGRPDSLALHPRFESSGPIELTLAELQAKRRVLVQNPTKSDQRPRITLRDLSERLPLSTVLTVSDTIPVVRGGSKTRPGTALVELTALSPTDRPKEGVYAGRLVMSNKDTVRGERDVLVTVAAALPQRADTGWTASIHKLALLPPARTWLFENAEGRCDPDARERTGFAASAVAEWGRALMGTCIRDKTIPLAGAKAARRPVPQAAKPDSSADSAASGPRRITRRADPTLIGVLYAAKGGDQALVWWTGDSLSVEGTRQGVELEFTSFDRPGSYYGKVNLAGAGAEGVVGLHVRVTHDWPMALLVIALGVYLSWWLRNYVRTRRAVLRMQETAADLVLRVESANETMELIDSRRAGYPVYVVDDKLLVRLHQMERQLQQHAYDGTVLEPGNAKHEELRAQLEQCEAEVTTWQGLSTELEQLRLAIEAAEVLEEELEPDSTPVLLDSAERLFKGKRLPLADVEPLVVQVSQMKEAVVCWAEVAQSAVRLQRRLGSSATEDDGGRSAAAAELRAAVLDLWAAPDQAAAQAAGDRVTDLQKLYSPRQKVLKMFNALAGRGAGAPAAEKDAGPAAPGRAPAPADGKETAVPAKPGDPAVAEAGEEAMGAAPGLPVEGGEAPAEAVEAPAEALVPASPFPAPAEPARGEAGERDYDALRSKRDRDQVRRQHANKERKQAEYRRKWNDRKYFGLTLVVAAATGLNQLYFKDGGFGTMQDYMVALLWGFGTKMGLDTVRTAVESGRIPFLKDGQAAAQPTSTQTNTTQTSTPSTTTQTEAEAKAAAEKAAAEKAAAEALAQG